MALPIWQGCCRDQLVISNIVHDFSLKSWKLGSQPWFLLHCHPHTRVPVSFFWNLLSPHNSCSHCPGHAGLGSHVDCCNILLTGLPLPGLLPWDLTFLLPPGWSSKPCWLVMLFSAYNVSPTGWSPSFMSCIQALHALALFPISSCLIFYLLKHTPSPPTVIIQKGDNPDDRVFSPAQFISLGREQKGQRARFSQETWREKESRTV